MTLAGGGGDPWDQPVDNSDGNVPSTDYNPTFICGEVVVKLVAPDSALMENINFSFGTTIKRFFPQLGIFLLKSHASEEGTWELAEALEQHVDVVWAHPNYNLIPLQPVQGSFALPDEELQGDYANQPAATTLNLAEVHQIATGSDVKVAVIDGGVNYSHSAFESKVISKYDYVDNDLDAFDEPGGDNSGHGTFVAGVIHLVAPEADIYAYRVTDRNGNADGYAVAEAIMQATVDGCHVINLSLVTSDEHEAISSAIEFTKSLDVLVIAAAGNGRPGRTLYPAGDPYVIAVGAIDEDLYPAPISNYDSYVDVWAPGVGIYSPYLEEEYAWWSGTSFAAAFVSGQAALIYSPGTDVMMMNRDWVVEAITSTVNDFGDGTSGDPSSDEGMTLDVGGVIDPLASLLLNPPIFAALIDIWNRGEVIRIEKDVSQAWDQEILAGVFNADEFIPYSIEISESASFIKSWIGDGDLAPCYILLHMDAAGLPVGYYQDTVFLYVEGAYNNPAIHIYTLHVSEESLPIHSQISCSDSVWNIYRGQHWPYIAGFAISAYQISNNSYLPVEAPYTIWQDADPEFVFLDSYQDPEDPPPDGMTPDGYNFDINVANTLPEGVYYDTIYACVEGSVDGVIFQPFELHITDGDSMWIDVVGSLPEGAYVEDDIVNSHYYVYFGDIEINSARVDTLYLSVNYTGPASNYTLDIYMKEYMSDTSMYNFIDIPRSGITNDTIQVVLDWSGHTHTSTGNYLRWYEVEIPEAINNWKVINFCFTVVENSQPAFTSDKTAASAYSIFNYPNPFNPVTKFSISLPEACHVRLDIYNILGRKVATPVDQYYEAGVHSIEWNGGNFTSGVYFYTISAGEFAETKKMILIK
jgi:hypothetical protein